MSRDERSPSARFEVGYGFSSKEFQGRVSVVQPLLPDAHLMLNLEGHARTDHLDQTGIGDAENAFAVAFLDDDYRDYHRVEGVSAALVVRPHELLRLCGRARTDDYESLRSRDSDLPLNPPVAEGTLRSLVAEVTLGDEYTHLDVAYEVSDDDVATSVATFEQLNVEARGRLDLGPWAWIDARVRLGTTLSGHVPFQRRYHVGGLGTVRGHDYQSLIALDPDSGRLDEDPDPVPRGGERALIGNIEYGFGLDDEIEMVLFADTGMAWERRTQDIDLAELKSSAGIGLQFGDDSLRINAAKPFDTVDGDDDIVFSVRARRMF